MTMNREHSATGRPLLIRADASTCMGTGHLMRCLALAHAWQDADGRVTFLTACGIPRLVDRLVDAGADVERVQVKPASEEDAMLTRETARRLRAGWVVLDGYHITDGFQRCVRGDGIRVLAIDDFGHAENFWADLVLNQNLHADVGLYRNRGPYTRLLLGSRFALLRREFWKWRGWKRETPEVARKVLVTLGGADPDNVTLKVIQALGRVHVNGLEAVIVLGAANPNRDAIEAAARQATTRVEVRVDVADMSELLAWADVALAAGGTTTWECALLGLPSLVVILADNQRDVAASCQQVGIGMDLGAGQELSAPKLADAICRLLLDRATRERMACRGQELVDGRGVDRLVLQMTSMRLRMRPACAEDVRMLWEWANDPAVRQSSFSSALIPWDEHCRWFSRKCLDTGCRILIALDSDEAPVGQARFDLIAPGEAEVAVSVARPFRGAGLGSELIRAAVAEASAVGFLRRVHAHIKPENQASILAFQHAGFVLNGMVSFKGQPAVHATWEEPNE